MVSDLVVTDRMVSVCDSLNPCFNGIWSRTAWQTQSQHGSWVLILVLMEYGLGHWERSSKWTSLSVLILVLMEYGLGPLKVACGLVVEVAS